MPVFLKNTWLAHWFRISLNVLCVFCILYWASYMNLWAQDIYSCDGNVIVLGTFLFYFFFSRTGTPFCPVSQDVLNIS